MDLKTSTPYRVREWDLCGGAGRFSFLPGVDTPAVRNKVPWGVRLRDVVWRSVEQAL
jgi:hypothetical protein